MFAFKSSFFPGQLLVNSRSADVGETEGPFLGILLFEISIFDEIETNPTILGEAEICPSLLWVLSLPEISEHYKFLIFSRTLWKSFLDIGDFKHDNKSVSESKDVGSRRRKRCKTGER